MRVGTPCVDVCARTDAVLTAQITGVTFWKIEANDANNVNEMHPRRPFSFSPVFSLSLSLSLSLPLHHRERGLREKSEKAKKKKQRSETTNKKRANAKQHVHRFTINTLDISNFELRANIRKRATPFPEQTTRLYKAFTSLNELYDEISRCSFGVALSRMVDLTATTNASATFLRVLNLNYAFCTIVYNYSTAAGTRE